MRRLLRRLKMWRTLDWLELELPGLVCKVIGHATPPQPRFNGDLLCPRCFVQVGRWR